MRSVVARKTWRIHTSRRLRLVSIAAAFGIILVSSVGGCRQSGPKGPDQRRVAIFALDGATWDLLDPFIERGLLPNLARLRSEGAWGPLQSLKPSSSPVIWTTAATGKTPEKHGITFFVRFPDGNTGNPRPVSRTSRRTKALWNILGESGRDVAVVGWFVTWPAEQVNGRMISDRAHYGDMKEGTFPPGYLAVLGTPSLDEATRAAPRFIDTVAVPAREDTPAAAAEQAIDQLVFDRFSMAYVRDLYYVRAARRVLEDGKLPDLFAVYLRGTDDVQHGFWKFMEPEPFGEVPAAQVQRFGKVIERYWQWTDSVVGELLRYFDEQTLVIVLSDHGAGPAVGEHRIVTAEHRQLSGSHRDVGILIAKGPGVRPDHRIEGASVYDITPTILHYLGMPVAADMDGKPLVDLFDGSVIPPAGSVATYETGPPATPTDPESAVDGPILDHLRSLGYIE